MDLKLLQNRKRIWCILCYFFHNPNSKKNSSQGENALKWSLDYILNHKNRQLDPSYIISVCTMVNIIHTAWSFSDSILKLLILFDLILEKWFSCYLESFDTSFISKCLQRQYKVEKLSFYNFAFHCVIFCIKISNEVWSSMRNTKCFMSTLYLSIGSKINDRIHFCLDIIMNYINDQKSNWW